MSSRGRGSPSLVLSGALDETADAFGEHAAEFRSHGTGWARREGVAALVPRVDLTTISVIEHGVYVTTPIAGQG